MTTNAWKNGWINFWLGNKPESSFSEEQIKEEPKQQAAIILESKIEKKQPQKPKVSIKLKAASKENDKVLPESLERIFSNIEDDEEDIRISLKEDDLISIKKEIQFEKTFSKIQNSLSGEYNNVVAVDFSSNKKDKNQQETIVEKKEEKETEESKTAKKNKLKDLVQEVVQDMGITRTTLGGGTKGITRIRGKNLGDGEEIFDSVTDKSTINFKTLEAGDNITLASTSNTVRIAANLPSGSGEANTAVNVGTGEGLFRDKIGVNLNFKSLKAGNNINLLSSVDEILISLTGEQNITGNLSVSGTTNLNQLFVTNSTTLNQVLLSGSLSLPYKFVTQNYTASLQDYTLNTTGTHTAFLPTAIGYKGLTYVFKNSGNGVFTVQASGSETIDGSNSADIRKKYTSLMIQSTGDEWIII